MDFDEHVEDESGAAAPESVLTRLNANFEAALDNLRQIEATFIELDEDEGRDEISSALEHVEEAWASRNRKLKELAHTGVSDDTDE